MYATMRTAITIFRHFNDDMDINVESENKIVVFPVDFEGSVKQALPEKFYEYNDSYSTSKKNNSMKY